VGARASSPPSAENRVEVNGDGDADGDLLQEARRRRPQDCIELIGFLLELISRTGRLGRRLRGHALIQQSIDDLFGEFRLIETFTISRRVV
jgi:hypothetical protein